jgi:CRP-like cAMP-binding protein
MATAYQAQRDAAHRNPLMARLESIAALSAADVRLLDSMCTDAREMPARRSIIREGDRPEHVHLMVEGWAARYKLLPDGMRQITAFLIPGDLCDVHITVLGEMDHSISTLTRAKVAYIPRATMVEVENRPSLTKALWWATLVDEAVLRAWLVNVGRRDALQAIGHLLCELYVRMKNVGLAAEQKVELPLTQEEIADALGLTPVHVNRVLQRLRADGLITLKGGSLEILDMDALQELAGFNPNYLHIERRT